MFFKSSSIATALMQVAIILNMLSIAAVFLAIAWRISGL